MYPAWTQYGIHKDGDVNSLSRWSTYFTFDIKTDICLVPGSNRPLYPGDNYEIGVLSALHVK